MRKHKRRTREPPDYWSMEPYGKKKGRKLKRRGKKDRWSGEYHDERKDFWSQEPYLQEFE